MLNVLLSMKPIQMAVFWFVMFLVASQLVQAQSYVSPSKSQEEIAGRLMVYVPPVYPAIAQAAKVQGDIVVHVEIGPDGLVRAAHAISGPKMLRQATADAVKGWRYQGFHDRGSSITVTGDVLVSFSLGNLPSVHTPHEETANGSYSTTLTLAAPDNNGQPDEAIANRYFSLWEECSRLVLAHKTDSDAGLSCKNAASVADEFARDRRYVERRQVYVYTAIAFANSHDLKTALPYADKAVEVVKLGHDDSSGREAAYSIRGQIRASLDDLSGGDQDLNEAEDAAREAKNPRLLKSDLQFHGELLKRMNRPKEAQAKIEEAAEL